MSAFDRISARTPPETRSHVSKTLDLVERIQAILEGKGMAQKDLALALGKSPSEISRWMSGLHNFELKTLVKIEEALGEEIFMVATAGNMISKSPVTQNSIALSSKMATLPDASIQQVIDFVDFLAQKEKVLPPQAKAPKPYKISTVTTGVLREGSAGKYKKRK